MSSEEDTSIEEVARRYDNRPGFKLVSCKEVGLPVYKVPVQALMLLQKPISPIQEFVLKAVDAGFSDIESVSAFLGLEKQITKNAMFSLRMSDDIDLVAPPGSQMQEWRITKKGEQTLRTASAIVPEEKPIEIFFDGIIRQICWYENPRDLLRGQQLKSLEKMEIPPFPKRPPELDDLRLEEVDIVFRKLQERAKYRRDNLQGKRELLRLKAISGRRECLFQEAIALVYKAKDGDAVQVAFAIDGRLSSEHENAFAGADGPKKLRIPDMLKVTATEEQIAEVIGTELASQIPPIEEFEAIKQQVLSAESQLKVQLESAQESLEQAQTEEEKKTAEKKVQETSERLTELTTQFNQTLSKLPVRLLDVYDHRKLLEKALQESQERLLIISPWIRANAVNQFFIQKIENLLRRGVQVWIGYGIAEDEDEGMNRYDVQAEEKLQELADKYDSFSFKRLGDTHAKVLISDTNFVVITSFNWLSFKGDPKRTFRDERGIWVSIPQVINAEFDSLVKRFDKGEK
jgi:hypothetical protein